MKLRRSLLLSCSSSLALVCLAYTSAEAQQFNWTGNTNTDWTTGSNWQGGAAPSSNATSTAQIRATSGTTNILTYTSAQGNSTFTGSVGGAGRGLVIGSVSSGSMSITGGTFSTVGATAQDVVGNSGAVGTLSINGGTYIAGNTGLNLTLAGGTNTAGTLTVNSGTATLPSLQIGTAVTASTTATVNLNGGTMNLGNLTRTNTSATSTFNFNGGSLVASGNLTFDSGWITNIGNGGAAINTGANAVSIASRLVNSGSGGLTKDGLGTLTLSGNNSYTGATTINVGTLEIASTGRLGGGTYAGNIVNNGTFSYNGSNNQTLSGIISESCALIKNGAATLTLSGDNSYTGATAVNAGALALSSTNAVAGTSGITVASEGRISTTVNAALNGKAVTITGNGTGTGAVSFNEGANMSSNATFTLAGNAAIRQSQYANLTLSNAIGESVGGSVLTLMGGIKPDASFNGSAIRLDGNNTFSGGLVIDSVKAVLNSPGWAGASNGLAGVTLQNGGGLDLTLGSRTIDGALTMTDGFIYSSGAAQTLSASSFTMSSGTVASSAGLTGTGSFTKTGAGTVTLAGTNTYTGLTTVSDGTLAVNGSVAGAVAVNSGATLQGSGSIGGALSVSGQLSPGNSIESIGASSVSFLNGSTYAYELNSSVLGGDLLYTTGALSIASTTTLSLTELASGTLAMNGKLTLISYGTWNGGLFTYNGNTLNNGDKFTLGSNEWLFKYDDTTGGSNFLSDQAGATRYITMTVVPEPNVAMVAGSLTLMALLRRRRD